WGINADGDVVGSSSTAAGEVHAFLYTARTGMIDLNSLLPANSGWELTSATGINDDGSIVGAGSFGGSPSIAFRMDLVQAVPAPPSLVLAASGVALLLLCRGRLGRFTTPRKSSFFVLAALALTLLTNGAARADYLFTTFDVPGAAKGTYSFAINDAGAVVGYYRDGADVNHGFLRTSAGVITKLDFPGAGATSADGITASGVVVGSYSSSNGAPDHGFRLSGGVYSMLDVPGSTQTSIRGVSSSGTIVGDFVDGSGRHTFLLK